MGGEMSNATRLQQQLDQQRQMQQAHRDPHPYFREMERSRQEQPKRRPPAVSQQRDAANQ
jgi:hypothetical protein